MDSSYSFRPNWFVGAGIVTGITTSISLWVAGLIADQNRKVALRDKFFIARSVASLATIGLISYDIKTQQQFAAQANANAASPDATARHQQQVPVSTAAQQRTAAVATTSQPASKGAASTPKIIPKVSPPPAEEDSGFGFWRFMGSLGPKPRALVQHQEAQAQDGGMTDITQYINRKVAQDAKDRAK